MSSTDDVLKDAMKAGVSGLCACTIHESGRGLAPCTGHAIRIREHQAMYAALHQIANGIATDPGEHAAKALDVVHYWHADHPLPPLIELRPGEARDVV